ncbi:MAG: ATP-binding protein [Pseudomonadota bacterium]
MTWVRNISTALGRGPLAVGLVLAVLILLALLSGPRVERYYLSQAAEEAVETVELHRSQVSGWLGRYRSAPSIYARHPKLADLLRNPDDPVRLDATNALLAQWSAGTGAEQTYLLDTTGLTVAASNWDQPGSFVGENYGFRPYFRQAMEGRLGRYFARGVLSGRRGYFFSHPVRDGGRILGVIVVKVGVDEIEQVMRLSPGEVFVSDTSGVVLMAGQPAYRQTVLAELAPSQRARIAQDRQFDTAALAPIPLTTVARHDEVEIVAARADRAGAPTVEFLHLVRPMGPEGWLLHLLVSTEEARRLSQATMVSIGLSLVVIGLTSLVLWQRRRILLDRLLAREREGVLLEEKVAERTKALSEEVLVRRAAEAELRQTQADLVQAGKLAVLGQMSTALSHEFNQPLTAIRSYAENAMAFVERGKTGPASENLARITRLTARMAQLSRSLSNFARKPGEGTQSIALNAVFDEALSLLSGRIERAGVALEVEGLDRDPHVLAGSIRLQHVLMNLIGNAIDACREVENPRIRVDVVPSGGTTTIAVTDNGAGIPGDVLDQVFDPFFTTKEVGEGLGLGLSISYNIVRDFDGRIDAESLPEGGARFRVTLKSAERPVKAAE